ncbi:hypothetical protein ABIB62_004481 [Mucilaginibacter sp. UYP25]
MTQIIYTTKQVVTDGLLGFTFLVTNVKISASGTTGSLPAVNPGLLGDIIVGSSVQWSDRHIFNMNYSSRFETDLTLPTGAFDRKYQINSGSHLVTITSYYAFTLSPSARFAISMRHMVSYNFKDIDTDTRRGASYNANYAFEFELAKNLRLELAGYYIFQLFQDSKNGDSHYYQDRYGILTTKERAFAYGPGFSYVTPKGLLIELKSMWETASRNRPEGVRSALLMAYKLYK